MPIIKNSPCQKLAMGKINNVHDAENDCQSQGHHCQDHAQQQTGDDGAQQDVHSKMPKIKSLSRSENG